MWLIAAEDLDADAGGDGVGLCVCVAQCVSGGLRRHCWKNACCGSEANSQTNRKHLLEEEKAADMYDVIIFYR